jgi:hypothetical protein
MTPSTKDIIGVLRMIHKGQGVVHENSQIIRNLIKEKLIRSILRHPIGSETGKETRKDSEITQRGKACLKMLMPT